MLNSLPVVKNYVTAKFLVMFVPAFLIFTLLALYFIAEQYIANFEDKMAVRIGSQVGRVASLIESEHVEEQPKLVTTLTSTLMSDPAITCLDIIKGGVAIKTLAQPQRLGCGILKPEQSIVLATGGAYELKVGYHSGEIRKLREKTIWLAIYTAIFGTLGALVFGVLGFKYAIGNSVNALVEVMKNGSDDAKVTTSASGDDEIGKLCATFNEMQNRISTEKKKTQSALEELTNVYNETPGLLFTMDSAGIINTASKYWLNETGYQLSEIVDRPLEAIMCPHSRIRLNTSVLEELKTINSIRDVPMCLWYKNGDEVDVLLSITKDRRKNAHGDSFVCVMNDVSLLKRAEKDLRSQAITDSLTGLPNRRGLNEHFESLCNASSKAENPATILFIDLDNFKTVNDTFGHEAGDQILRVSAVRIESLVGNSGIVSRIGGDEFAVVLLGKDCQKKSEFIAQKLVRELSQPVTYNSEICYVGASIGIAHTNAGSANLFETLRLSDQAMYVAKSSGKNQYYTYEKGKTAEIQTRAEQIQLVQNGISKNWFDIYLQPIMNMDSMQPCAFEALLRVTKESLVPNSIESLIRVAEETGNMEELGMWIFEKSISQFRSLCENAPDKEVSLTVNLSPKQLTEGFVRSVKKQMAKMPDMQGKLIFEITETAAMQNFDAVCCLLHDLRQSGIQIALDDFGTGYSSLSYISRLPISIIKLDKSFIQTSEQVKLLPNAINPHEALVRTLVTLANELNLRVVAEGLETIEVKEKYQGLGIKYGQGYLFSKPMPVSDASHWLNDHSFGENKNVIAAEANIEQAQCI